MQGSDLYATRNISITSTAGDVWLNALTNNVREGNYDNIYTDHAILHAGSALTITSARDIQAQGLSAWSGDTTLQSVKNIAISGTASTVSHFDGNSGYWRFTSGGNGDWVSRKRTVNTSYVSGDYGVKISAGGNIDINATTIQGGSGYASLKALGSIKLNAAQSWSSYDATSSGWKSSCVLFFCKKTTWTDYYLREYLTTVPTSVYGLGVRINAGNDIETYGAHLQSWWKDVSLVAGGAAKYYAVYDQQNFKDTRDSKSSFLGIKYSTDRSISSSLSTAPVVTRLQSKNELTSGSGGDTLLQGTVVNAPGGALFRAGVGEKARADARIVLEGVKSTVQTAQTRESNYVLWQKQSGQGGKVESMALPSFVGGVSFKAPGGLSVQIPEKGEFKTQIQSLAKQPGMGYLKTLTARNDVNWQPVKLAFDKWSYSQSGLTPAGAALVAVAVAWATGGMGAELLGTAGTTTTTVGGVATTSYTTAGLVANAAITSLASQASITLINNKGDVGKTLKELGSSSTVKAALAAALTAGVLDKVGAMPGMQALKSGTAFSDKLTYNLISATGRALTNTAINGGSLEDALKAAIVGGIVDTAHGAAASQIKGLEADYIAHKLAHALAGCVAGAAASGACWDGAIGAAVGEIIAGPDGLLKPKNGMFYTEEEKRNVLAITKLVGGAVSAYAGGNAQTAITTAEVAVSNNAFFVPPLIYLLAAAAGAYTTGVGGGNPVDGLKVIGNGNDPLSKAMATGTQAAVSLSMSSFPAETRATLNLLSAAGQQVDATVTYLDDKTGRVVSTQWNSLSPDTRAMLIGAGTVTGVVFSPVGVGQVKNLVLNAPKAVSEQTKTIALQNMIREAGAIDPATGKASLSLQELAKQPGGLTSLKEATGDLFGSATMQTLFKDAQYVGGAKLGEKGLDAVYKVNSKNVDYLFVEYKYNTSTQGMTNDGLQGSAGWVTGSQRIERAVGDQLAPSVRSSANAGRTETLLIQTLPDGRTNVKLLDNNGKSIPITQSRLDLVQRIATNLNKGVQP